MQLSYRIAITLSLLLSSGSALAADLIGIVTDRSGRPQAGAPVELLTAQGEPLQPPRRVSSNAQGQYLIPNIEANAYRLKCGETVQNQVIRLSIGMVRFDCQL